MDTFVAIEISEGGLLARAPEGGVVAVPAVALLERDGVVARAQAAVAARMKPVLANDRFLAELSLLPLPAPQPLARHTADLAWATFLELVRALGGSPPPAIAALPSHWSGAQAGLVASIARDAGLPLAGSADAAVAATVALPQAELLYLDVDLHRSRLVRLGGGGRRRLAVEIAPRVGGRTLATVWAQFIAETFVRRTRFDPLHDGASEQRLYDALPGWLERLGGAPTVDIELEHAGGAVAVTLPRDQLLLAAEAYYAQLAELLARVHRDGEAITLALTARAAALPGLATHLGRRRGLEVVALPHDAALTGLERSREELLAAGPGSVCLSLAAGAPAPAVPERVIAEQPTHVLHGGRVYPIGAEPLVLGRAPEAARPLAIQGPPAGISARHCSLLREGDDVLVIDHSRHGTFLNGARVQARARLAAGDTLRLGTPGVSLELVALAEG